MRMNMTLVGEKLTFEMMKQIYVAGWIDGYVSEDVTHRGVNRRIDGDFLKWFTCIPQPPVKLLQWKTQRPLYDHMSPDVSELFR